MGCEAIFVDDISTKVINLTAPANNATVQETTVNFLWESVEGAERYQLQVARPGFAIVVDQLSSLCVEIVEMERSHSCERNMFNFAVQFIVFNGVNG